MSQRKNHAFRQLRFEILFNVCMVITIDISLRSIRISGDGRIRTYILFFQLKMLYCMYVYSYYTFRCPVPQTMVFLATSPYYKRLNVLSVVF
jgi:hypothetical protein